MYKTDCYKGKSANQIREELKQYILDVEPNNGSEILTDRLLEDLRKRKVDKSPVWKEFFRNETQIAQETGSWEIHDLIQRLRQLDRNCIDRE